MNIVDKIKEALLPLLKKNSGSQKQESNEASSKNNAVAQENIDYFKLAPNWASDCYVSLEISRNRWKSAVLYVCAPAIALLLFMMTFLIPMQHFSVLKIDHFENGLVTVTPLNHPYAPSSRSEVEANITRYIRFRESYSSDTYDYSFRLIKLMSLNDVARSYEQSQSASNKQAPINILGNNGYQSVTIQNITFLDNEEDNHKKGMTDHHHKNLAQVDFVVTTHNKQTGGVSKMPLSVLISWEYRGNPNNPEDRWMDWNGFTVTSYQVTQRNTQS